MRQAHSRQWIGQLLTASLILLALANAGVAAFKEDYDRAYAGYQAASDQNSKEKLRAAAEAFHTLSLRGDAADLKANCFYWQGQCLYQVGEYLQAMQVFERSLTLPINNKEEAARFKVVQCLIRLKWKKEALWEIDRFKADFPKSNLLAALNAEIKSLK